MSRFRKLINGEKVKELNSPMNLIIKTKCPTKWIIEDLDWQVQYVSVLSKRKEDYIERLRNKIENLEWNNA